MNKQLSIKQQQMVLDNKNLVHYLVQRIGVSPNSTDYEDIVSIGTIGLIKATITFDISKDIKFATYASRCINNEIFMHYRKANKYANDISLDEPISDYGKDKELILADKIEHPESNFIKKIVDTENFNKVVSIILNYIGPREKVIILYMLGDVSQTDISEKLKISQAHVSRTEKKVIKKIKEAFKNQLHYKEVFSMKVEEDVYKITFASKDINNFNKIFATLLKNVKSVENIPDFKVNCNKERIIIQIPADLSSFSFIAQIIQEIDDFSIKYVSDKNIVDANDTVLQKDEPDVKVEEDSTVRETQISTIEQESSKSSKIVNKIVEDVEETMKEPETSITAKVDSTIATNTDLTAKKENQVRLIREYMLSKKSFTTKELKQHFPNFSKGTINNAIYLAKNKKMITSIDRGKYVVNNI